MGIYAHILKNWEQHDPVKVFTDVAKICLKINARFHFDGHVNYYNVGVIKNTYVGIMDSKNPLKQGNSFNFNIQGVNMDDIAVGLDRNFDYLISGKRLCSLAYIEKVNDLNTEIIFQFAHEYLKLNPDEYFWFEWDYAFSLNDLEKLKTKIFDPDWCFKIP